MIEALFSKSHPQVSNHIVSRKLLPPKDKNSRKITNTKRRDDYNMMSVNPSKINIKHTLFLWIFYHFFQRPSHHSQFLCAFSPSRAVQNWYLKNATVMLFHIYYLFLRFNFTYILYYDKRIWQSRNCLNIGGSFQSFFTRENQSTHENAFLRFFLFFHGLISKFHG